MKLLYLFNCALAIAVIAGCSSVRTPSATNLTPSLTNVSPLSPVPRTDVSVDKEKINKALAALAEYFKVAKLSDKPLKNNELELRIWGDNGFDHETLFIAQSNGGRWKALLTDMEADADPPAVGKVMTASKGGPPKPKQTILPAPISGWTSFASHMEETGVKPPFQFEADRNGAEPVPDEAVIIMEIKQGDVYSAIWYREFTNSEDGKKVLGFCRKMEIEFSTFIGCGV